MHSVRERPSRLVCISSLLSVEITPTKFSLNARGFLQTKRQQIATRSVYDAVGIQLPPFQVEGDGHKSLGKEPSENVVRSPFLIFHVQSVLTMFLLVSHGDSRRRT